MPSHAALRPPPEPLEHTCASLSPVAMKHAPRSSPSTHCPPGCFHLGIRHTSRCDYRQGHMQPCSCPRTCSTTMSSGSNFTSPLNPNDNHGSTFIYCYNVTQLLCCPLTCSALMSSGSTSAASTRSASSTTCRPTACSPSLVPAANTSACSTSPRSPAATSETRRASATSPARRRRCAVVSEAWPRRMSLIEASPWSGRIEGDAMITRGRVYSPANF
jgi:hypothetical protein